MSSIGIVNRRIPKFSKLLLEVILETNRFKLFSIYYDPMIGKIISHDLVREDAIDKLITYLKKIQIKGIKTNIPFLI